MDAHVEAMTHDSKASDLDKDFQQFLDNVQYKFSGILRYERVFGEGYVSTGGIGMHNTDLIFCDVELGVVIFYLAENFAAEVFGIDLSINMVSIALERAIGRKCSVEFEVADCTKKPYPDETFDVIYSRDTILHIQ
ncbi:hypothetical protein MKW94_016084, partial [Papaver nudicaule]|nr:hypothetical protein [Papaver nudicaule]